MDHECGRNHEHGQKSKSCRFPYFPIFFILPYVFPISSQQSILLLPENFLKLLQLRQPLTYVIHRVQRQLFAVPDVEILEWELIERFG